MITHIPGDVVNKLLFMAKEAGVSTAHGFAIVRYNSFHEVNKEGLWDENHCVALDHLKHVYILDNY